MYGNRTIKGFTLIELSIVIVIIGLIVAGITGGQKLVEQSKLRKVISDIDQISTAVHTFRLQYGTLPGDLENGYDYWGSTCGADSENAFNSCNGDGNGQIGAFAQPMRYETRIAWKHLSLSGIINDTFPVSSSDYLNAYKKSPFDGAYYGINTIGIVGGWDHLNKGIFYSSSITSPRKGLFIALGKPYNSTWTYDVMKKAISPHKAKSIDVKIDDGVAQTGGVLTFKGYDASSGTCGPLNSGGGSGQPTDYVLTDTGNNCRMSFQLK